MEDLRMRSILCNTCGAIGYSAGSAAYLIGGCTHCGAHGTLANLEEQKTVVFDGEFTYGVPQFRALIEAVTHTASLLGDQNLHGLAGLLQYKLDDFQVRYDEDEITLNGLEMAYGRAKAILWSLNRFAAVDRPEEDKALDNGLLHLYYLRCDLYRILHTKEACTA